MGLSLLGNPGATAPCLALPPLRPASAAALCLVMLAPKHLPARTMPWNASLDWAEEVFALWVVLPPVIIGVALLWYFAPRIGNRRH